MVFIPFFYRLSTIQGGAGYGFYPIFYRLYDASHDFDEGYNPMIYSVFFINWKWPTAESDLLLQDGPPKKGLSQGKPGKPGLNTRSTCGIPEEHPGGDVWSDGRCNQQWINMECGYGSIPMKIPFLGEWTSILTQLFWCEQKGYYWFWHTAMSSLFIIKHCLIWSIKTKFTDWIKKVSGGYIKYPAGWRQNGTWIWNQHESTMYIYIHMIWEDLNTWNPAFLRWQSARSRGDFWTTGDPMRFSKTLILGTHIYWYELYFSLIRSIYIHILFIDATVPVIS